RRWAVSLPAGHNAFVYVYEGVVRVGDRAVPVAAGQMGILTTDPATDGVVLRAAEASRVLLIAGAPLREPIVQYGPFVMNNAPRSSRRSTMRPPAASAPFRPATSGPGRRSNEDCRVSRASPARAHLRRVRVEWFPSLPSAARDATSGRRFL